jgi:hypothetical protein
LVVLVISAHVHFFIGEISPKREIRKLKIRKLSDFGGKFSISRSERGKKKKGKSHEIYVLDFECVAKYIKR